MSTLQRFFTSMIASTILMASFTASAQSQRGPSTPEERARVIAIAEASDKDPLAVRQSEDSKWFEK